MHIIIIIKLFKLFYNIIIFCLAQPNLSYPNFNLTVPMVVVLVMIATEKSGRLLR